MSSPKFHHDQLVLTFDGEAMIVDESIFKDDIYVYDLFNPVTQTWRELAEYHIEKVIPWADLDVGPF